MRQDPQLALNLLRKKLAEIRADPADVVLFGSLPMWFHGLIDGVGDIDVFVRRYIYDDLLETGEWVEHRPREEDPPFLEIDSYIPIHVFYDWTKRHTETMDIERNFAEAEFMEGWYFAPLTEVRKWKLEAQRGKDLKDIKLIDDYVTDIVS